MRQEKAGKPHFASPHSQIGLGFIALVLSTYASAFYNVATNGPAMVRRKDGLLRMAGSFLNPFVRGFTKTYHVLHYPFPWTAQL